MSAGYSQARDDAASSGVEGVPQLAADVDRRPFGGVRPTHAFASAASVASSARKDAYWA